MFNKAIISYFFYTIFTYQFISFLQETKSTVVTFPPSYLELLSKEDLKSLKTIITAGESANPIKAKEIVENKIGSIKEHDDIRG